MSFKLQIKRGATAPGKVLDIAELGFDTVAKRLYIGNGIGSDPSSVVMVADNVVNTFSGGTTGLTPNTATAGNIVLGGTLVATSGGTGLNTYAAGDLIYASAENQLAKLGIGSNGQVLTIDGSVPKWLNIPAYGIMSSTIAGLAKLASDVVQTEAANVVTATASRTYGTQFNAAQQLVVNVPWTDTTYSLVSDAEVISAASDTARLFSGKKLQHALSNIATLNLGNAAGAKTINIGTGGVAGNISTINIGTATSKTFINGEMLFTGTATEINTTTLTVSDYIIEVAKGTTGLGSKYAGLMIKKYNGTDNLGLVANATGEFRIGKLVLDAADLTTTDNTQPVLTRAEVGNLVDQDILVWDATTKKAITKTATQIGLIKNFSGGTTGLTGSVADTILTLSGTLVAKNGGTGQSTYAIGDLLYASTTSALSRLTGNTANSPSILMSQGSGTVASAPIWAVALDCGVYTA